MVHMDERKKLDIKVEITIHESGAYKKLAAAEFSAKGEFRGTRRVRYQLPESDINEYVRSLANSAIDKINEEIAVIFDEKNTEGGTNG